MRLHVTLCPFYRTPKPATSSGVGGRETESRQSSLALYHVPSRDADTPPATTRRRRYLVEIDVALIGGLVLSRAPSLGRAQGQSRASRSPPSRLPSGSPWRPPHLVPPRGGSPWRLPVAARRRACHLRAFLRACLSPPSLPPSSPGLLLGRRGCHSRDGRSGWLGVAPAREALATATAAAAAATTGRVARRQRRPYTPTLRRREGVAPGRARTRACRPHHASPFPHRSRTVR